MNQPFLKKALPHILAFVVFLIALSIYFSPVFSGKSLVQTDVIQFKGALKEVNDYQQQYEEDIQWSGSTFSGMPVWTGLGNNIYLVVHRALKAIFAETILLCFLSFAGFYILLSIFGASPWVAFAGGAAYAFSTFTLQSILAGHINKVYAMAYMAPVLAGVLLILRQRYLTGALLASFALGMQIFYGHIQISYYLTIMILILAAVYAVFAFKNKEGKQLLLSGGVLLGVALLGIGGNAASLWTLSEYGKSTIRGGSELSEKATEGGGLDKDYALSYSYGIWESFNHFIPRFMGGGSAEQLDESSATYKALVSHGVQRQQAEQFAQNTPTYWGTQPFTAGPVYLGAVVVFLFVLGLFLVKGYIKWWIVIVTTLAILLSWGRNLEWFTDIFFYYVPLYNKFRTVTMALTMVQLMVPLLGFIALMQIAKREIDKKRMIDSLKYAFGICGVVALFFALFGGALFDFASPQDASLSQMIGGASWLADAVQEDRASMLRTDALRSLIFVTLTAGLLYLFMIEKLQPVYLFAGVTLLVFADLWPIDKKYLNNDNFVSQERLMRNAFTPTPADTQILQDEGYYRVLNLSRRDGPFNDGVTSYFHKSLGGYSAIKLGRYQELIEAQISQNNQKVLNMLNTKYFIVPGQNNEPTAQRNPGALGPVWFVDNYEIVENADAELAALTDFEPKQTAIIDNRFSGQVEGLNIQSAAGDTIYLESYHPDKMVYHSKANAERLAVFSEIYYQPGWQAYVDNAPVDHLRANYVLRAMRIPAGEHTITFEFKPTSVYAGKTISIISSVLLVLLIIGIIAKKVIDQRKGNVEERKEVLF